MTIETRWMTISGLPVAVVRKEIKNLHLGVYPPDGRIRVAAPLVISDAAVRVAVVSRLRWIKRKREAFQDQVRESRREMVTGESHYFLGRRFRLEVVNAEGSESVVIRNSRVIELRSRPTRNLAVRGLLLQRWYRERLRELVPPLLEKWQTRLDVQVKEWRIKKMKTKWGSCNAQDHRIWLNLELAKKPSECLEYLIVHELVHLIERHHNDRFLAIMNRSLPKWRVYRQQLNAAPLSHESWKY